MARPSKRSVVTPEERQRIIEAIRSGKSRYAVANEFQRSRSTIAKIAREAGLDADRTSTAKATRARTQYAAADRLELINQGFAKVEAMLANISADPGDARNLREIMTSLAILIDKRRIEDGDTPNKIDMRFYLDALQGAADEAWSEPQ